MADLSATSLTTGSPALSTAELISKLALRVVEERHKQFEAGEGWALLDAIDFCARAGIALPEWAATAFCERYMDWFLFRARSLDTAFGVGRKGMRVDDRMHREWLRPRVVLCVLLRVAKGEAIDPGLFERVGKEDLLGEEISGSLAKDIYYEPTPAKWVAFVDALLRNEQTS